MALLACGSGGPDTGEGPSSPLSYPTDSSAEGIEAFLASGAWREAPWVAETDAPREPNNVVSPHGRVQVWLNDVLLDSVEAGNGAPDGTPHDPGSMTVKELFNEDDVSIGLAVMLKLEGDLHAWAYWCDGPAGPCGASSATSFPYYGIAYATDCGFCHGGLAYNAMP